MTEEQILWLVFSIGVVAIVAVLVVYFVFFYPKDREKERLRRQKVLEEYEKEPTYEFISAKVLSKRKNVYYKQTLSMPAIPNLQEEYYVTFETEKGEKIEYPIRQELWEEITDGQEGVLVTVNGNFFDFGDGEDLSSETIE